MDLSRATVRCASITFEQQIKVRSRMLSFHALRVRDSTYLVFHSARNFAEEAELFLARR